ncbi:MAG: sugar fermentation stimulation protein [Firmicutes bacterium HGW-Firmicutes-1]|jgi:hypothetical protein|nr:MAG: sugar fermentation stimulation protein [Firmicutes bacterium HGW-Firmicutes-1]
MDKETLREKLEKIEEQEITNAIKKSNKLNKRAVKGWLVLLGCGITIVIIGLLYRFTGKGESIHFSNPKMYGTIVDLNDFMIVDNTLAINYSPRIPIRGIFLTANTAGIQTSLDNLIKLANETEINAFVIDVKNDDGHITYDMDIPLVDQIGSEYYAIKDIDVVMDKLYDNNIYPIARIVAFKDPYLSSHVTEYAIKNQDGSLFQYKNITWISPYNKDAWKYIIDVAKEAAKSGFKEIQFDYIRFEATHSLEGANFGATADTTKSRTEVIVEFIEYAQKELEPYDVAISADVFGTIIISAIDANMIGQNYYEMSKRLDVICPMVYPSHYGRGYYGVPASQPPDLFPYEIIYGSMQDSNKVIDTIPKGENRPIVRPWLQAFTASYLGGGNYMTYDGDAIKKQIQAAYDAGLDEWLLWNSGNRYYKEGLIGK